jgi:hypothetical protein
MENIKLPSSIRLLFNNPFLEMMHVLYILNTFSKKSGLSIRHILFYYSLTLSDTDLNELEIKLRGSYNSDNIYFDIQKQIKQILMNLYSQDYIDITKDKHDNFNYSVTILGRELIANLESPYYIKLQERIDFIKSHTKYSVETEKLIMGVKK